MKLLFKILGTLIQVLALAFYIYFIIYWHSITGLDSLGLIAFIPILIAVLILDSVVSIIMTICSKKANNKILLAFNLINLLIIVLMIVWLIILGI